MTQIPSLPAEARPFGGVRLLGYSLGSFGTGVFSTVPAVLLLYFCTQTLLIPAQYAALIVFAPKAWAIVWDPFVGVWSDGTRSPIGRRRPFVLVGAIGIVASFIGLFAWPYAALTTTIWMAGFWYFLMATTYSLFAVPYVAFPAEASADPKRRETIVAWRIGFAMIGSLIGAAVAPMLVAKFGGGRGGYADMSFAIAAVCGLGMGAAFISLPSHTSAKAGPDPFSWRSLKTIGANRDYRNLILSYLLQITGVGVLSALTPYWVVFARGGHEGDAGLMLGSLLLATIAATPVWALLTRRLGGGRATFGAALLYAAGTLSLVSPWATAQPWRGYPIYALIGVAFSGLQVAPFALAANLVHAHAARTGERREGLMTGVWTAGEKFGLALGPGAAGLGLAVIGFSSGATHPSPRIVEQMGWLIAAGPAVFLLASLIPLLRVRRPQEFASATP